MAAGRTAPWHTNTHNHTHVRALRGTHRPLRRLPLVLPLPTDESLSSGIESSRDKDAGELPSAMVTRRASRPADFLKDDIFFSFGGSLRVKKRSERKGIASSRCGLKCVGVVVRTMSTARAGEVHGQSSTLHHICQEACPAHQRAHPGGTETACGCQDAESDCARCRERRSDLRRWRRRAAAVTCRGCRYYTWAVAILAFLNILFAVAGDETFWIGASPAQVIVGQRTAVSISGSGFLVTAFDYYCRFETAIVNPSIGDFERRESPMTILSQNAAKCTTPEWDLPATDATLKVVKADAYIRKEGRMKTFRFLHAVNSSEPMSGISNGAQNVTINGVGFGTLPGQVYTCTFTGTGGREATSAPCSVQENSAGNKLMCSPPKWPYPAGLTRLTVRVNDELLIGKS